MVALPPGLDEESHRDVAVRVKAHLRQRMRGLRQALPAAVVRERSDRIVARLVALAELQRAGRVALYWPMEGRGEVDIRPLDGWLRERGTAVYYPFQDPTERGYRTGFRLTPGTSDLVQRGQPYCEPPRNAPEAGSGEIDVVVVPALAVAPSGHRLGHGSGFYDVTLPEQCPPGRVVVVAYDFQLLAELPVEPHDRAATVVITDRQTLRVER